MELKNIQMDFQNQIDPYKYGTVRTVLSGHSKKNKNWFSRQMGNILQNFRLSLSYHLSLRSLFCLFLIGRLRQIFLYMENTDTHILLVCFSICLRKTNFLRIFIYGIVHDVKTSNQINCTGNSTLESCK